MKRSIYSTGADQSQEFLDVGASCRRGDSIELVPEQGRDFVLDHTVDWTRPDDTKICVEAKGAVIRGAAKPLILYGGRLGPDANTPGNRGYGSWSGGTLYGNLLTQNLCYSELHFEGLAGSLVLALDNCSSYLSIFCSGVMGDGANAAVIVDQKNDDAWANAIDFVRIKGFAPSPNGAIQQLRKTAYVLGTWCLHRCFFEGTGKILDIGRGQIIFDKCYFEGSGQELGNSTPDSQLIFSTPGGVMPWAKDQPRVILEGNQY